MTQRRNTCASPEAAEAASTAQVTSDDTNLSQALQKTEKRKSLTSKYTIKSTARQFEVTHVEFV